MSRHSSARPIATRPSAAIDEVLRQTEKRMRSAHATHLGYPYNLVGNPPVPASFGDYLVNNLGDPYVGSHYASETCDLEREAVAWLMDLWECDDRDDFWGSVGASGTEGNIWALYLAREAFPAAQAALQPRGALLDPEGRANPAHATPSRSTATTDGAIDIEAFAKTLDALDGESGDRGADLRHDGEGRPRRHRGRHRLPRRGGHRSGSALRPCRRRAERHGAAVRRRSAIGDPAKLPPCASTASPPPATR